MTTIKATSLPLSMPRSQVSPRGQAPSTDQATPPSPSRRIFAQGAGAELAPTDSFQPSAAPVIRSLDPSRLPPTAPPLTGAPEVAFPPAAPGEGSALSKDRLVAALSRAVRQLPSDGGTSYLAGLGDTVRRIRARQTEAASQQAEAGHAGGPQLDKSGRRIQALRERLAEDVTVAAKELAPLEQSESPRVRGLFGILRRGLQQASKAAAAEAPAEVSPEARSEGAMALAMTKAMAFLSQGSDKAAAPAEGQPADKADKAGDDSSLGGLMQRWVLMLEEKGRQGQLSPQDLIDAAAEVKGQDPSALRQETASMMRLMGENVEQMMKAPLAASGLEAIKLMQDMPPRDLAQVARTSRAVIGQLQDKVLGRLDQLYKELEARQAEQAALSAEAQALIDKADELALRSLSPVPEPPHGFEKGVISLIQEFIKIIRNLDHDIRALQLQQTAKVLERRKLDSAFLHKLLEGRRHESEQRQNSDALHEQVRTRYDQLATRLQEAALAA